MTKVLRFSDLLASHALAGKRVLIRADLNVPLNEQGEITEDTRIRASLPALRAALEAGAAVMVTSHLGRPKEGELGPKEQLAPIAKRLGELLGRSVPVVQNWIENGVQVAAGDLVVLENCRANHGEKQNSEALARKMAALCDVYVNDAFGAAHRKHASTYGVAQYAPIACAGPLLMQELEALARALEMPKRPLVAIVAGSKVSTKLTILKSLASKVDQLIVGGGIANTFMLAAGLPIGRSLAEPGLVEEAKTILTLMHERGASIPLPIDVVTAKECSAEANAQTKQANEVADDDLILDIGPATAAALAAKLEQAGTIVWNGPLGVFELEPFSGGTKSLAQAIAHSPAFSIAGGGDTLAAIAKYQVTSEISYISTGGGAFLSMLEGHTLPAVEALEMRSTQLTHAVLDKEAAPLTSES